jgi:hypothetical protein
VTRNECERQIAEKLAEIREIMLEYSPNTDYLSMCIIKSKNGNDDGEWDCWSMEASNKYYGEDKDFPINLRCHKDIKDEKYWACVSEEDDKEEEKYDAEQGWLLPDGTVFIGNAR